MGFDSWVHSAASLSIVTVIAGWFGTYIQYFNVYEQKVGATAQADMAAATATFLEISNAYAEAQTEQQLIYFNFRDASKQDAPPGDKEMATKSAQAAYPDYVKARHALRQNSVGYSARPSSTSIGRATCSGIPPTPRPSTAIR
jgi:hypothetical protein